MEKKSIFFNLPYWEYNLVRHNLDVMHIEKKVCNNLIYTLLGLGKKSKDNVEARLYLKEMNIRPALWPQQRASGRTYLSPTYFTMSPKEKRLFYEVLENVKFPYSYASNISGHKEVGFQSHCLLLFGQVNELDLISNISNDIKALAQGPCYFARRFKAFHMNNGYRFRTKQYEEFMQSQNSGVLVVLMTESYASTTDSAPKSGNITYYDTLNDIVELNYYEKFKVVLFKCDWVDVTQGRGVMKDDLGFTLVNFSHLIHSGDRISDEPFVFAGQAQQVIFVQDPEDHEWFVPRSIKPQDIFDMGEENSKRFDSSMQCDTTDLTILENIHDLEDDNNGWVRVGVDGIEIGTD
ncbi:hypothetical protein MTR67_042848 [Solanum verrucosum]|uniref:DUF4216 domain-containing protein n=1 Tax=Solanum verrucosum TaxID=315347 RepID=A0AAF0UMR2_SOLVR|nr:hypothetical protein MTR67_042848 [Solanum verrucosum]